MKKELELTNKKILDYFNRMQNDKVRAINLLEVLRQEIKAIEQKAVGSAFIEDSELPDFLKETVDYLKGILKTLTDWLTDFDVELLRVQEAMDGLQKDDIEEVKKSFQKFVLEDTAFSVQNVSMMFYDFDRMIETAKAFHDDV